MKDRIFLIYCDAQSYLVLALSLALVLFIVYFSTPENKLTADINKVSHCHSLYGSRTKGKHSNIKNIHFTNTLNAQKKAANTNPSCNSLL